MPTRGRTNQPDVWGGQLLDLEAYLHRIGIDDKAPEPTFETLRVLQRAHITSIPFENGETILGRPTPLDVGSLQDKMIRHRRGGYCFEHANLYAAALEQIGFGVTGLLSRITMGAEKLLPATHAAIKVDTEDDDRTWISDVGRGGGPLEPIELADGATLQDNWRFTLGRGEHAGSEYWTLYASRPEGWLDLHRFTLTPSYPIDYVVGNHYIATHPDSPFSTRILAQKLDDDTWHFLDGTTLTSTYRGGPQQTHDLDPTELPKLLEDTFDIALDPDDASTLIAKTTKS